MEFTVTERKLPQLTSFALRVDSSLGDGVRLPADAAEALSAEALKAAQEGASTAEVCLSMLPRLQEFASAHAGGQVQYTLRFGIMTCISTHHAWHMYRTMKT